MDGVQGSGTYMVLPISGKLMGGPETSDFSSKVSELQSEGVGKLILDLSAVQWINSAGIGVLVGWFVSFRNRNGTIKFANLSPKVAEVFAITKLNTVLDVYESVEAAQKSKSKS
ncbi:STAS domain-containing protein [candidate division KSB1 bacterium]|nr:STAS domain-containing protein [candidate division KSB1 bacterium]